MKYGQLSNKKEHGFGEVETVFVVSDSYTELFDGIDPVLVDCLSYETTEEGLDSGAGAYRVGEITFRIHEQRAVTDNDNNSIEFILAATDDTVKRYAALFVNTSDYNADDAVLVGLVNSSFKGKDIVWNGAEWGTNPAPVREWECKVQTFSVVSLAEISMDDLFEKTTAIEEFWETTRIALDNDVTLVKYGQDLSGGAFDEIIEWKNYPLVNLNTIIGNIAYIVSEIISDEIGVPYEITVEGEYTDIGFTPTMYNIYKQRNGSAIESFSVLPENTIRVRVGDTDVMYDYVAPYISSRMIFPQRQDETAYSIRQFKNVAEFLYSIAFCFGMYLEFEKTSETELKWIFRARSGMAKPQVYFRDVTDGSVDTKPAEKQESVKPLYGQSCRYAVEGLDVFVSPEIYGESFPTPSDAIVEQDTSGNRIFLTVSPVLRMPFPSASLGVPLGMKSDGYEGNSIPILSTGIHLKVAEHDDTIVNTTDYQMDITFLTGTVYRAAGRCSVNIDGVNTEFETLAKCLQTISGHDSEFFATEYVLNIPYLMQFSLSADGSAPSWKNVRIGSTVVLDAIEYVVTKIRRNWENMTTELTLHNASRFSFAESEIAAPVLMQYNVPTSTSGEGVETTDGYIAGEDVKKYDALSLMSDRTVSRSISQLLHYERYIGIALSDANEGDRVRVQTQGRVYNPIWSFDVGARVYVWTSTIGNPNVTTSFWSDRTEDDTLVCVVGIADSERSVILDQTNEYILTGL